MTALADDARHLSRWPITPRGKVYDLRDWRGRFISFHRTKTGALRRRAELIEEEALYAETD
jgi:hypothetical protein